jgi:hypothetical protein
MQLSQQAAREGVTREAKSLTSAFHQAEVRAPDYDFGEMSTPLPEPTPSETLELPVAELLRRARPLPPYGEMVIDDLTADEADAFLAAVNR